MTGRRSRSPGPAPGIVSSAIAGVAALWVSPGTAAMLPAMPKTVVAQATLLDTEAWVMGFAADVGLVSVAGGFLGETFLNAAASIGADLQW